MPNPRYAIYPDDATSSTPAAVFEDLEDAMDWAERRYPGGACRIGYIDLTSPSNDEASLSGGARARS